VNTIRTKQQQIQTDNHPSAEYDYRNVSAALQISKKFLSHWRGKGRKRFAVKKTKDYLCAFFTICLYAKQKAQSFYTPHIERPYSLDAGDGF
jgi:hypothetical protein